MNRFYAALCSMALVVGSLVSPVFAEDQSLVVPTLGIDWGATVTSLTTSVATIVVAALGLWAGFKLVMAAKRFIGSAVTGR